LSRYMAILRYRSHQIINQRGVVAKSRFVNGQGEKVEHVNNKTDHMKDAVSHVDKLLFKYGIPELVFENPEVIDRIIHGVQRKERQEKNLEHRYWEPQPMTPQEFMKCTSFIIATTFEEKIDMFFQMIDLDGNGLLSWDEINDISLQSLSIFNSGSNTDFI